MALAILPARGAPAAVAHATEWTEPPAGTEARIVNPDPVLLFRFSALTFNSHRIHYDHTYATDMERYPGLLVHGPLLAILLMEFLRRKDQPASQFNFSFRAPLYCGNPFRVLAKPEAGRVALWAEDPGGGVAVEAEAVI